MTRALYPGTFDPIHNGHIDIVTRASKLFDEVVMAVYDAPPNKKLLFNTEERLYLAHTTLAHLPNVEVQPFTGLVTAHAQASDAQVIVRGLRNVADFEYENQMGWANSELAPDIDLCFLLCKGNYAYVSSSILKEVTGLGGDTSMWAPSVVLEAMHNKLSDPSGAIMPAPRLSEGEGELRRSSNRLAHKS
ncbi:MAG: pantetheine-phosphate adenylyltransferase [Chloroflexota bacterium]